MPYEISIDHTTRTIVARGFGHGTTDDTLQAIADQQVIFRTCPGYKFLYHASKLEIASSAMDLLKVAETLFEQTRATVGKLAIVVPEGRVQLARMFAALATPYGVKANVFLDVEDAREWLRSIRR